MALLRAVGMPSVISGAVDAVKVTGYSPQRKKWLASKPS
jgi:hypothetical protein